MPVLSRLFPHVHDAIADGRLTLVTILGLQRSGSSLLAAMLGRHPDVAMLYEAYTHDLFKLYGKPFAANKLLVPHQIQMRRKATVPLRMLSYAVGRIPILDRRLRWTYRIPAAHYSLEDLRAMGTRLVIILRDREAIARSMMRRSGYSRAQAEREIDRGLAILDGLQGDDCLRIRFEDLLAAPASRAEELCNWLGLPYAPVMLEGAAYNLRYPDGKALAANDAESS